MFKIHYGEGCMNRLELGVRTKITKLVPQLTILMPLAQFAPLNDTSSEPPLCAAISSRNIPSTSCHRSGLFIPSRSDRCLTAARRLPSRPMDFFTFFDDEIGGKSPDLALLIVPLFVRVLYKPKFCIYTLHHFSGEVHTKIVSIARSIYPSSDYFHVPN
ncbi:hypothetical protein FF38_09317 [Lucilia cuprina]|uniref:Uncharacterized protein n=1 Tax=Lucilia cuprina TaxID=7375 RepID=A0A0L0BM61_LUCCU|nr:hypothetical protein FF38_09317 [Lucilia cuprina]